MSKKRRRDGPGQPPSQSAAAAAGPNRNPTTTSTDASKSNPNSTASPAGKRQRTGPQNPSAHLNAGTSNTTAATDSGSGIYARLPSAVMNDLTLSAGEAPPVDPKTGLFTPGFVNRLLTNTQDLTATVSDVNEASTTTNTKSASTLSSAAKSAIYQSRVQGKVLLVDNPPRDESAKEARREERRKQRRRKVLMNSKDKRKLGIYEIPVDCRKYELFEPLHKLWTQYMHELLGEHITNPMNVMPKLLKADYHGCILTGWFAFLF
ncbi:RNase P/RNase MRP complex subunit [Quaeritorhiza haematococci]|nr:RNase P/RNase MRP complex subunit [Quaeritorhiza haematococci]